MYGTQEEITNRVTEAVSTILDALNGTSSREVKEMVLKRLLREHRTLQ
jgi:DNA-binding protein Fis